jgi:uncharacterized membrane protein YkvA (DUF1232 family)
VTTPIAAGVGVAVAIAAAWLALVCLLLLARPPGATIGTALRLMPDALRLLGRLARDPEVPRGVRVRLWLLLAYLATPIDLIPDFVPVLGYADDAVVVVLALRLVLRRAGPDALRRNWRGDDAGLAVLSRLAA